MTKPYASLINSEMNWMNEAQSDWGAILVDPDTIAPNDDNPALKRIFQELGSGQGELRPLEVAAGSCGGCDVSTKARRSRSRQEVDDRGRPPPVV